MNLFQPIHLCFVFSMHCEYYARHNTHLVVQFVLVRYHLTSFSTITPLITYLHNLFTLFTIQFLLCLYTNFILTDIWWVASVISGMSYSKMFVGCGSQHYFFFLTYLAFQFESASNIPLSLELGFMYNDLIYPPVGLLFKVDYYPAAFSIW